MYRHLLVPLDGSPMAEEALPVAAGLARQANAGVTLLHVLERHPPKAVHGQPHLTDPDEAEAYLAAVAAHSFPAGTCVARHVHREAADRLADSLAWHGEELEADLIVMSAHGSVRLRDRLLGNLAQQLMTHRVRPVLLVRPGPAGRVRFPFRRVLVPLDGQGDHECSLPPAAEIAALLQASLMLLTVVPASGTGPGALADSLLPGATGAMLEISESAAAEYLEQKIPALRVSVPGACGRVVRGEPGRMILRSVRDTDSDLIVLGTHGKAGTHAFWSGSLAPRLLRRAAASFLLVPAGESETR